MATDSSPTVGNKEDPIKCERFVLTWLLRVVNLQSDRRISDGSAYGGLTNIFCITDVEQKMFFFMEKKPHETNKQKMWGCINNLLGCESSPTVCDVGHVRRVKVMQMCQRLWQRTNSNTSCQGLKIISWRTCNSLRSNAASSSIGSSKKRKCQKKKKIHFLQPTMTNRLCKGEFLFRQKEILLNASDTKCIAFALE